MPLYEYRCSTCGKTFEVIQKFADAPLTVHEDCGGAVEKLLSAPAFHLKGSGWYATDYAKSSSKTEGKSSESKAETKEDSKSDPKSDAKPAATETKAESKPAATTSKTD